MHTRRMHGAGLQILLVVVLVSVQSRAVMSSSWNVSCCAVFEVLNEFTVERTGSSLAAATCRSNERECMNLKLIVKFVEQSRTIMGTPNVVTSGEDNLIHFRLESGANEAHILDLLAWAFVGRIVALPTTTSDMNQQSVILQYDVQTDELTIQRDSCQIDKTLYNTMVLGSVTLLIFFISAMVVEKKRNEKQPATAPQHPATHGSSQVLTAQMFRPLLQPHTSSLAFPF